jgi:hypothetical protein
MGKLLTVREGNPDPERVPPVQAGFSKSVQEAAAWVWSLADSLSKGAGSFEKEHPDRNSIDAIRRLEYFI